MQEVQVIFFILGTYMNIKTISEKEATSLKDSMERCDRAFGRRQGGNDIFIILNNKRNNF